MIHILHHQEDRLVDILSNQGARVYWNDVHDMDVDGMNTHQFVCLAKSSAAQHLEKRARYIFPSEDGDFYHEMIVMEARTRNGIKQVYAKASYQDINTQRIVEPRRYQAWTLSQYVGYALLNTEWTVGTVEYSGIRSKTFESHLGAYDFLKQVKTLFDHEFELRFRVVADGNTIVGRYVDLVSSVGEDNKKEIVYAKDLLGIEKIVYNERIVTQLIALGPERQDGTRHQVTVSDDEAFQRWNRNGYHITDIYIPETTDQEMTLARLTSLAKTELNKRVDSIVEYQIDVITIERLFPHERVRLGDQIRVKDEEFVPPLYAEARVIRVIRSLTDENEKTYFVGEFVEYTSDDLFKAFREMQTIYGLKVIHSDIAPTGSNQLVWIDTSQTPNVPHTWNGVQWVKFSPTAAAEIGAETPQGALEKAEAAELAAIETASTDATNKANEAERAAIETAAADAKAKADAAQTAAQTFATSQASAAQTAAISAAAQDAATKAAAAEAAAKTHAETQAAAAQTAAEQYALLQAQGAEQSAIDAAAIDSATKAAAAEQAAKEYAVAQANAAETAAKNYALELDTAVRQDFSEMSGGTTITQSTSAPTSPVLDDLWIDLSTTPYTWKRWDGTKWVNAIATSLAELGGKLKTAQIELGAITAALIGTGAVGTDELATNAVTSDKVLAKSIIAGKLGVGAVIAESIAANSISSNMIATVGLDAAVIKFGTMSGDRIFANSLDANRLKAGSVIANNITFTGILSGASGTFSGTLDVKRETISGSISTNRKVEIGEMYGAPSITTSLSEGNLSTFQTLRNHFTRMYENRLIFHHEDSYGIVETLFSQADNGLTIATGRNGYVDGFGGAVRFDTETFDVNSVYYSINTQNYSVHSINQMLFNVDSSFDVIADSISLIATGQVNSNPVGQFRIDGGSSREFYVARRAIFYWGATFQDAVSITYPLSTTSSITFSGYSQKLISGSEFVTNSNEEGYCGIGGIGGSGTLAGVGVNFRTKKTYVPSSIYLTQMSGNSGNTYAIDISVNGFWLYITSGGNSGIYYYWRGRYSA